MSSKSIEEVLQSLNKLNSEGESASAPKSKPSSKSGTTDKLASARSELEDVLHLLNEGGTTKEASTHQNSSVDAVSQLEKVANDMANADLQATIKEAHLFGAAVFDGFLARANKYAGYEKTAQEEMSEEQLMQLAAAMQASDQGLDQQQLMEALQQQQLMEALQQQQLMEALQHQQLMEGGQENDVDPALLDQILAENAEQQAKVAHGTFEEGVADALQKLASDAENCFIRGQQHALNLLNSLG